MIEQKTRLSDEITAAFAWWQEAGVDLDFVDDATDWLAVPAEPQPTGSADPAKSRPSEQVEAAAPQQKMDLLGPNPPQDLRSFQQWWMEEPGLDPVGSRGRIAPRGEAGADLMVLVVDPEESDRDRLLSGPQGRLLARIFAAMGLEETQVYLASALPRHTPMADGTALVQAGYADVLIHHVKIARPKKILAFGTNILPLLGHNAAQDPQSLREINHESASTPLLVTEGLDSMLAMPRLKARFWRRWLEWTDG